MNDHGDRPANKMKVTPVALAATGANVVILPHWNWPPLVRMLCKATSLPLAANGVNACKATSPTPAATGVNVMRGYLIDTGRHWCVCYVRLPHWHQPPLV